jgi:hypothetical protein
MEPKLYDLLYSQSWGLGQIIGINAGTTYNPIDKMYKVTFFNGNFTRFYSRIQTLNAIKDLKLRV